MNTNPFVKRIVNQAPNLTNPLNGNEFTPTTPTFQFDGSGKLQQNLIALEGEDTVSLGDPVDIDSTTRSGVEGIMKHITMPYEETATNLDLSSEDSTQDNGGADPVSRRFILATANLTITLPPPDEGIVIVVKDDGGGHTVTVDGDGNNIDGAGTYSLSSAYASVSLMGSGSEWYTF